MTSKSPETSAFKRDDPDISVSNTGDPSSFAYGTARTRWPKIFDQALGDIASTAEDLANEGDRTTANQIKDQVTKLKESIASDGVISLLSEDGEPDIPDYNAELTSWGDPTWLKAPWLYAECYLYRRIYQIFLESESLFWLKYDAFQASKRGALVSSEKGTIELVKRFRDILEALKTDEISDETSKRAIFEEIVQISLWGNATDLSLLQGVSVDQLDSIQGKKAREASKANVLADDTGAAWELLTTLKQRGSTGEIHVVLDNAGFELLTDLVLVSYLLSAGFATKIILHGKRMPWFVSDVNRHDLDYLIDSFVSGKLFPNSTAEDLQDLQFAGKHWQGLLASGKLEFEAHTFWTTTHPFGRMHTVAPDLYDRLVDADLVIYKGDLNYRKLTYDALWPHTTPFVEALGPFAKKQNGGKGTRTLALRTAKADVAVGVAEEKLKDLPQDWTYSGKWAMVQYFDGKA